MRSAATQGRPAVEQPMWALVLTYVVIVAGFVAAMVGTLFAGAWVLGHAIRIFVAAVER